MLYDVLAEGEYLDIKCIIMRIGGFHDICIIPGTDWVVWPYYCIVDGRKAFFIGTAEEETIEQRRRLGTRDVVCGTHHGIVVALPISANVFPITPSVVYA